MGVPVLVAGFLSRPIPYVLCARKSVRVNLSGNAIMSAAKKKRQFDVKDSWREFLSNAGAVLEDGVPAHFGDPARELQLAEGQDIVADLSTLGLIAVRGGDTVSLLQGQVTSDAREVSNERSQMSAMCNPKGRMLADFRIVKRADIHYLVLPAVMLQTVLRRLQLFVLRADAQLEDASNQLVVSGLQGSATAAEAQRLLHTLPSEVDHAVHVGEVSVIRLAGMADRFLVLAPEADAKNLWKALTEVASPVGAGAWALTDILAGVPTISPETAEAFLPQMVNYQAIGGVSFTKGCYTGQEVVARTQYLGKLKRRMYRARVYSDGPPSPGDQLFAPNCDSGQGAGRVVSAQPHPKGGYELLAVIRTESADKDTVHLQSAEGPVLELETLPYSLDS